MKRVFMLCMIILLPNCAEKNQSKLDAVKGEGWFKDGYLYALSSPSNPADRCWYYNSKFKNPFTGSSREEDAAALRDAQPLTLGSTTPEYLADLLSTRLQTDKNNQALASSLATGACAISGTVTMTNPAAKVASVVFCTGIKESIFQLLKNASDTAARGTNSTERLAGENDRALINVSKDVTNLFYNALKFNPGDGTITDCRDLKEGLTQKEFDRMAGVPIKSSPQASSATCSSYRVNADVAKVYTGNSANSSVKAYGIGRNVIVDVASSYKDNSLYRIYVKPRSGTSYAGQGVWMDLRDLACL